MYFLFCKKLNQELYKLNICVTIIKKEFPVKGK